MLQASLEHLRCFVILRAVAVTDESPVIGRCNGASGRGKRSLDPFQILHHFLSAGISLRPLLVKGSAKHPVDCRSRCRRTPDLICTALIQVPFIRHQFQRRTPYVFSGHHAEQQIACSVQICRHIQPQRTVIFVNTFRRCISFRCEQCPVRNRRSQSILFQFPGCAEIDQRDHSRIPVLLVISLDKQVVRLDVTVNIACFMHLFQRRQDLDHDPDHIPHRKRIILCPEDLPQRNALFIQPFHQGKQIADGAEMFPVRCDLLILRAHYDRHQAEAPVKDSSRDFLFPQHLLPCEGIDPVIRGIHFSVPLPLQHRTGDNGITFLQCDAHLLLLPCAFPAAHTDSRIQDPGTAVPHRRPGDLIAAACLGKSYDRTFRQIGPAVRESVPIHGSSPCLFLYCAWLSSVVSSFVCPFLLLF